ncbi:hypothetical protein EZS27_026090 [termite gut metagenome]|uniref:Lipoprotein n=1 Tax=termite gut metagenome TaxID=433724 RepID=A0A5J4QUP2_9ZZZZ
MKKIYLIITLTIFSLAACEKETEQLEIPDEVQIPANAPDSFTKTPYSIDLDESYVLKEIWLEDHWVPVHSTDTLTFSTSFVPVKGEDYKLQVEANFGNNSYPLQLATARDGYYVVIDDIHYYFLKDLYLSGGRYAFILYGQSQDSTYECYYNVNK